MAEYKNTGEETDLISSGTEQIDIWDDLREKGLAASSSNVFYHDPAEEHCWRRAFSTAKCRE